MRGPASVLVAFVMSTAAAQAQSAAVPTIEAIPTADGVRIVGRALALAPGRYEAMMEIEKSGPSGRTATSQGRTFELEAGTSADVATVALTMGQGDRLSVDLEVTDEDGRVARSTLSVGE